MTVLHPRLPRLKNLLTSLLPCALVLLGGGFFSSLALGSSVPGFEFGRDTFSFANETVFEYREGHARLRTSSSDKSRPDAYTRRCFVMSRAVAQFHKFARFDPAGTPLGDRALAARVRALARQRPWQPARPEARRIVFPGYANLRALSQAQGRILQENLGLGWPTYFRPGNWRMFTEHSRDYQKTTHAELEAALARGEFFVGYLSTFPKLSINHAVLFYGRKPPSASQTPGAGTVDRYWVYDPNHPDAPRELVYSPATGEFAYQKDWDFVGGFVRVYHIFGRWFQ
jgi:hypothetical protein